MQTKGKIKLSPDDELTRLRKRNAELEAAETERKRAEEELRASEERYRGLSDGLDDMVFRVALPEFRYEHMSPAVERILGYRAQDFLETPGFIARIIHPDFTQYFEEKYAAILRGDVEPSYEYKVIDSKGKEHWIQQTNTWIYDDDGRLAATEGICRDVTEQKLAQEALRKSEERFRALIENASDAVFVVGPDGTYKYVSPSYERITGYSPEEELGVDPFTRLHPDDIPRAMEMFTRVLETPGNKAEIELRVQRKDGQWITVYATNNNLMDNPATGGVVINFRDVTDSKLAEEQLQLFRRFADASVQGFGWADLDGTIRYANRALLDIVEAETVEEVRAANVASAFHSGEDQQIVEENVFPMVLVEGAWEGELNILTRKGMLKPTYNAAFLMRDDKGEPLCIANVITDITERKQAEEKLRASEERFRSLLENAHDVITLVDAEGTIVYESPSVEALCGFSIDELMGSSIEQFVHPDDWPLVVANIGMILTTSGAAEPLVLRIQHKDGSWRWIEGVGKNMLDDPKVNAVVFNYRDITERKLMEDSLRESEKKFRTIFENVNDEIVYIDEGGTVLDVNSKVEDIFGYKREEVIGKNFAETDFASSDAMMEIIQDFAGIFDGGKALGLMTYEVRHRDGTPVVVEVSANPIQLEDGSMRSLSVIRDVTDRKQAEEDAYRLKALEEIERLRSSLIANVSHELRTPLAAIRGLSDTLIQPDVEWDSETQKDYLKTIVQEVDRLTHIVNDLVELSQLESGMMKMQKEPSTLSALGVHLRSQLRELTIDHELAVSIPANLPPIDVDETRIGEVIINLISNAVAYSGKGSRITIEGKVVDGDVVVSIIDEGIGIPEQQLAMVFERFYRGESGVSCRRGGTGLGLAISKQIIDLHEGRIWVESEVGRGSTFSFSLPIATTYTYID